MTTTDRLARELAEATARSLQSVYPNVVLGAPETTQATCYAVAEVMARELARIEPARTEPALMRDIEPPKPKRKR